MQKCQCGICCTISTLWGFIRASQEADAQLRGLLRNYTSDITGTRLCGLVKADPEKGLGFGRSLNLPPAQSALLPTPLPLYSAPSCHLPSPFCLPPHPLSRLTSGETSPVCHYALVTTTDWPLAGCGSSQTIQSIYDTQNPQYATGTHALVVNGPIGLWVMTHTIYVTSFVVTELHDTPICDWRLSTMGKEAVHLLLCHEKINFVRNVWIGTKILTWCKDI